MNERAHDCDKQNEHHGELIQLEGKIDGEVADEYPLVDDLRYSPFLCWQLHHVNQKQDAKNSGCAHAQYSQVRPPRVGAPTGKQQNRRPRQRQRNKKPH